jgi:hypothetical protein
LKEALAKAEDYVSEKGLDISAMSLASIWHSEFPGNPKQNCWTVIWVPNNPRILDGELRVYIFDDGRIQHGGSS